MFLNFDNRRAAWWVSQGRLPIRVQLKGLSEEDMYRILTEPVNNLIRQQVELMKTEKVSVLATFFPRRASQRPSVACGAVFTLLDARACVLERRSRRCGEVVPERNRVASKSWVHCYVQGRDQLIERRESGKLRGKSFLVMAYGLRSCDLSLSMACYAWWMGCLRL